MIVALMLATAAACSNYWIAVEEILRHKDYPPIINVAKESLRSLRNAAQEKARELGYGIAYLDFELYGKDDYYIAYFRPMRHEDGRMPLGGDLLIILNSEAKVLCFFKGE